jgi:hypothetical protein
VLRFRKGEPLASQSVCMNNHRAIHYRWIVCYYVTMLCVRECDYKHAHARNNWQFKRSRSNPI